MKSRIGYQGRVSIKIKNKPPIRKSNSGTLSLFKLFGHCLDTSAVINFANFKLSLPAYVDILLCNDEHNVDFPSIIRENSASYSSSTNNDIRELHSYSVLKAPVLISYDKSEHIVEEYSYETTFKAMINTTNLDSSKLSNTVSECYVCLIDARLDNILAFVPLEIVTLQQLSADIYGQATLEWVLEIGNSEVSE